MGSVVFIEQIRAEFSGILLLFLGHIIPKLQHRVNGLDGEETAKEDSQILARLQNAKRIVGEKDLHFFKGFQCLLHLGLE